MTSVIRTNLYILTTLLILTALSQAANAEDMKIHYHCTSEKAVEYRHTKASLGSTIELQYTPDEGANPNLVIGIRHQYILWVRKPYKETKRFISVFESGNSNIIQTLDLGEAGQEFTAVFNFEIKDLNGSTKGSCEITAE